MLTGVHIRIKKLTTAGKQDGVVQQVDVVVKPKMMTIMRKKRRRDGSLGERGRLHSSQRLDTGNSQASCLRVSHTPLPFLTSAQRQDIFHSASIFNCP